MKQKKKNGFLLFCFSFMPGAGEMYMGFMKMGFSLMAAFFGLIFIVSVTGFPELSVFPALLYIYSFFHAHNIAGLDDESFYALEDQYLFGIENIDGIKKAALGKSKKWVAAICIIFGAVMMWNATLQVLWDRLGSGNYIVKTLYSVTDYAPKFLIGIVIVVVGIKLIAGKKADSASEAEENK